MLLACGISFLLVSFPLDSLGLKVENGRVFILHEVDPGETLFAISQRYKVSIEDIRQYNNGLNWSIQTGQILKIPRFMRKTNQETTEMLENKSQNKSDVIKLEKKPVFHTVQEGDNLYNVSQKYGITVRQLIDFNKLESTLLSPGQQLIVGFREQPVLVETEKPTLPSRDSISIPSTAVIEPYFDPYRKKYFWNVQETGLLDTIQSSYIDPEKFYGLHNFLPEGAIVEIRHPVTNRSVFVKIVGKLEDGTSSQTILQVTDKTIRYLGYTAQQSKKAI
ncbi:MAG: LysM peptidoglycan-binding domain-containing protein, partial [Bacteroidia bacterium]|nr:LysM peptidoglycan-binding domain-containing protein [Bacteroidia bacterium]